MPLPRHGGHDRSAAPHPRRHGNGRRRQNRAGGGSGTPGTCAGLLHEWALRMQFGGRLVMREQLHHLCRPPGATTSNCACSLSKPAPSPADTGGALRALIRGIKAGKADHLLRGQSGAHSLT
ncbi:Scr1 family TA system antitoxin-like transcriptional regulator [Streptomyces tendae]|uniref:Scr1 family TA system antitoxin-like transcriptional regulator n=1 Tax=Streptomyces tendae TaxID=1932 RepID=UPI0033B8DD9B